MFHRFVNNVILADGVEYSVDMEATAHGWKIFDADMPLLMYSYFFGLGIVNVFAVGGEGGLVIVSPPYRVAESVFEDLCLYGPVRALIASNAFHYMGIPEWKRRFPDAAVFVPAQSIARVEWQTKLHGIRSFAEAVAITGPRLDLIDMLHYRTGEVLVRVKTARGFVWYVTDIILNMLAFLEYFIMRMLFRLSGTAFGFRFNNIGLLFMVKDKLALKRWLAAEYEKDPSRWLIATYGDIADFGSNPEAVRKLFGPISTTAPGMISG